MVNRAVIVNFIDFINLQYFVFFLNCNTTPIYHEATIFCLFFRQQ